MTNAQNGFGHVLVGTIGEDIEYLASKIDPDKIRGLVIAFTSTSVVEVAFDVNEREQTAAVNSTVTSRASITSIEISRIGLGSGFIPAALGLQISVLRDGMDAFALPLGLIKVAENILEFLPSLRGSISSS